MKCVKLMKIPNKILPVGEVDNSYFELVIKVNYAENSEEYGFTPYWNEGGYCKVIDWR